MDKKFLGIGRDKDRVAHTVTDNGTLHKFLVSCLEAYKDRTEQWSQSDNSQVLEAINNLTRKVNEFMATQEERLKSIDTKLDGIKERVTAVLEEVKTLKVNNPEIEDELTSIESKVGGIGTDLGMTDPIVVDAASGEGDTSTDSGGVTP